MADHPGMSREDARTEAASLKPYYQAMLEPGAVIDGHPIADDYRHIFQRTYDLSRRSSAHASCSIGKMSTPASWCSRRQSVSASHGC